jgi:signal transduction histidine kinase
LQDAIKATSIALQTRWTISRAWISPEHRARIAQPFFTTKPNGTGLGLWISQTLIAQHGGTLEVNARPSGGTVVLIKVPAPSGQ